MVVHERIKLYEEEKITFGYTKCANDLTILKKEKDFLKEVDSISLQQALRHLDTAFQNFFKNQKTRFPNFKSKKNNHNSYTTVCMNHNIKLENGMIALPKIGKVKVKQHRDIPEHYILKSVTVSQTPSGKYYASILFEYEEEITEKEPESFLGLDFSMKELYVDSNGHEPAYPRYYRRAEKKLKREQRKLSKMVKGSKNREKQRIKVAKMHEKLANQRKDFLHKQSRKIANSYDCVCIENLNMQAMAQLRENPVLEFAPGGCRKPDMQKCLKYLISCAFSISSKYSVSRIQGNKQENNGTARNRQEAVYLIPQRRRKTDPCGCSFRSEQCQQKAVSG